MTDKQSHAMAGSPRPWVTLGQGGWPLLPVPAPMPPPLLAVARHPGRERQDPQCSLTIVNQHVARSLTQAGLRSDYCDFL